MELLRNEYSDQSNSFGEISMVDITQAAQTVQRFLQSFISTSQLRLTFRLRVHNEAQGQGESWVSPGHETAFGSGSDGRAIERHCLKVEFTGPDTAILLARNADLLNSLEHVAAQMLHLEPEENDRISFDADDFKADRDRRMREMAASAIRQVRATDRPHSFPAMSSRERRTMHLLLSDSGLPSVSSGEGPARFVVLYPLGEGNPPRQLA